MTGQASLFDTPASRGASRLSDPATSRDAGRSLEGYLPSQQAAVLAGIGDTATAYEVAARLWGQGRMIQQNVVARRLTELRSNGLIRPTGDTRPGSSHRLQRVYALTDKGRQWLEAWT